MESDAWSSAQQAQLDQGLSAFRVEAFASQRERWQRISDEVDGKNMKQCVQRYREIRESIAVDQYLQQRSNPPAPPAPPEPTASQPSKQPKVKTNVRKDWGNTTAVAKDWGNPSKEPTTKTPAPKKSVKKEEQADTNAFAAQQQRFEEDRQKNKKQAGRGETGAASKGKSAQKSGSWVLGDEETGIFVSDGLTMIDDDLVPSRSVAAPYKPQPKHKPKTQLKTISNKQRAGRQQQQQQRKKGWWRKLQLDDPISLEPLSELEYPPFRLKLKASSVGGNDEHLFDGQVLAYFLVSTANFIDPLSREPLTRDDCRKLDEYLKQHGESIVLLRAAVVLRA
jgi:hypothetical protein